jgi:cyclic-di-GMP phosphodiesterase TipF (flagellum assembly factor)
VIPIEMLREAVADNRIVFHIEPIVALPQRRPYSYDVVPRLRLEDDELADAADFMPRHGGEDVVARLEADAIAEAVTALRRVPAGEAPLSLHVPLSRASLASPKAMDAIRAILEANRALLKSLHFTVAQSEFIALSPSEQAALKLLGRLGVGFSLADVKTLRCDYPELQGLGFRTVRIDATRFLRRPESFTDFHPADAAAYVGRFEVDLIATGVIDEQQLLAMLENGIALAQGPHVGAAGPMRADLRLERDAPKRLAQIRL